MIENRVGRQCPFRGEQSLIRSGMVTPETRQEDFLQERIMKSDNHQFTTGVLTGIAAMIVGYWLGGWTRPAEVGSASLNDADVLTTKRLEVVDDLGTVLAVLGANKDGGSLSMKDRFGRTMVLVGASASGGTIVANQAESGAKSLVLGATKTGGNVAVFESSGGKAAELAATEGDGGVLAIHRPNDKGIAIRASVNQLSGGLIETLGEQNQPLVRIASSDGDQGQITTFAGESQPLIQITSTNDQQGQLYAYGKGSQPLIALASNELGPALRVFNRDGQPVMSLESDADGNGVFGVWKASGEGRTIKP